MTYITVLENNGAGIGHNLHYFFIFFFLLKTTDSYKHLRYIHTPFAKASKHYDTIFCIDQYGDNIPDRATLSKRIVNSMDDFLINDDNTLLVLHDKNLNDLNINGTKISDNDIFVSLFTSQKPLIYKIVRSHLLYDTDSINIAVHIRRGDIMLDATDPKSQFFSRFLPNTYYVDLIKQIRVMIPDKKLNINIISEGVVDNFKEFEQIVDLPNIHINYMLGDRRNESVDIKIQTVGNLIFNDILVTSPSGLSNISSIYSTGVVINNSVKGKLRNEYLSKHVKCVCLSTCNNLYEIVQLNKARMIFFDESLNNSDFSTRCVNYVPLGPNCPNSEILKRLNIRKYALPFDWLMSGDNKIIECVNGNFEFFLHLLRCNSDVITDHYGLSFPHVFPRETVTRCNVDLDCEIISPSKGRIVSNWVDYVEDALLTFDRRIKRFISIFESPEPVFVLRLNYSSINQHTKLLNCLRTKYNKNNIFFIVTGKSQFNGVYPHTDNIYEIGIDSDVLPLTEEALNKWRMAINYIIRRHSL